jgi:hypothetical protein
MLDDYLIIRKDNELNHGDQAQVNIYSDKNITNQLCSVSIPSYFNIQGVPKKTKTIEITNNNLIVRI